jgi:membrane-bound metal-dependent hydrolase YbcI (DUF457 family)
MDTITHAFAGALLGKGLFSTNKSESLTEFSPQARVAIFAATLGSAFPDVDFFYEIFSRDPLRLLKYHRFITHSLILLPLWALLLAWLVRAGARRFGFAPPSFTWTYLATAVGIASHILLDVVTSFGTMIWSPFSNARVSLDLAFILDFILTAIFLLPQVAAWVYRDPAKSLRRASRMWALFTVLALGVNWLAAAAGFPFSLLAIPIASAIFAAILFLPMRNGRGARIKRSTWARAGLLASCAYLLLCVAAHQLALSHLRQFVASQKINAQVMGALPIAPSLLNWDGLIRTPNGAYRFHDELFSQQAVEYDFFPDSAPDNLLVAARQLPETRTYLWFARFPIYRLRSISGQRAIDISDLRFMMRSGRSPNFTYRVTFDSSGNVVQNGLVRGTR